MNQESNISEAQNLILSGNLEKLNSEVNRLMKEHTNIDDDTAETNKKLTEILTDNEELNTDRLNLESHRFFSLLIQLFKTDKYDLDTKRRLLHLISPTHKEVLKFISIIDTDLSKNKVVDVSYFSDTTNTNIRDSRVFIWSICFLLHIQWYSVLGPSTNTRANHKNGVMKEIQTCNSCMHRFSFTKQKEIVNKLIKLMKRMKPQPSHVTQYTKRSKKTRNHKQKRNTKRRSNKGGTWFEGENVSKTTVDFAEDDYEDAKWWFWFWIVLNWIFGFAIFLLPIICNFTSYFKMKRTKKVYRRVKQLFSKQQEQADSNQMQAAHGYTTNPIYKQSYDPSYAMNRNMQQGLYQPLMQPGQPGQHQQYQQHQQHQPLMQPGQHQQYQQHQPLMQPGQHPPYNPVTNTPVTNR
jgi:hypothetical protein